MINSFNNAIQTRDVYKVAGPKPMWHHDGNHKLVQYGIVVYGFIDGYSRLATGLRARTSNRADTVLRLFLLEAASEFGVPSRVRGDRGGENVEVAYGTTEVRGENRGSYLWGTSPHNTRIERLWPEAVRLCLTRWHQFLQHLVEEHNYDLTQASHLWLGSDLFLGDINDDLERFRCQHNHHPLSTAGYRAPVQLYWEGMIIEGVRGLWVELDGVEEELATVRAQAADLAALREEQVHSYVELDDRRLPWPAGCEEEYQADLDQFMRSHWREDPVQLWQVGLRAMYTIMEQ